MLLESGSTSAERLCLGPENSRLMRKLREKNENEGQRGGKTRREKKKSNGAPACPRIRAKQQREESKQRALGKEKAAAIAETLGSRLDDVLVGDRALLRRDEGNSRVLLGEVLLLLDLVETIAGIPSNGEELRSSADGARVLFSVGSRSRARMSLESASTSAERLCWGRRTRA